MADFWSRVDVRGPDECWPWMNAKTPNGYGTVYFGGRMVGAHRVSWELTHGPIPDGLFVLHHCDNPPCCNPAHLFTGTHTDNVRDMRRIAVKTALLGLLLALCFVAQVLANGG